MSKPNAPTPSSNWLALQKNLPSTSKTGHIRKKRKIEHTGTSVTTSSESTEKTSFARGQEPIAGPSNVTKPKVAVMKGGESVDALRRMVLGQWELSPLQMQPGKYLALDCEMVGVGIDGSESSLARVSLVNYHGAIQMDEFVRQRERVVDYRTQYSGVRESDMINAKLFSEVQQKVADLLKDRILVGHAVHNDLKALLLSHPHSQTRDTQLCAAKHKLVKSKKPALRHLVKQELNMTIQDGEHSSVVDARATMAIYRLHRKEWDKSFPPPPPVPTTSSSTTTTSSSSLTLSPTKRSLDASDQDHLDNTNNNNTATNDNIRLKTVSEETSHADADKNGLYSSSLKKKKKRIDSSSGEVPSGGGRKGVSSGLSTIIKHKHPKRFDHTIAKSSSSTHLGKRRRSGSSSKSDEGSGWWKKLGEGSGAKASSTIRVKA